MIKFICYPKCTTCQKAKKWLDDNKIEYEFRDIKDDNPSLEDIELTVSLENHVDYGHVPGLRTYKGDIESLSPRQKAMLAKVKAKKEKSDK